MAFTLPEPTLWLGRGYFFLLKLYKLMMDQGMMLSNYDTRHRRYKEEINSIYIVVIT